MIDDSTKFYDELKKMNEKAHSDVVINFSNLVATLHKLDPIKLLSQLSLTFLTGPENQFVEESSDTIKWSRYIEFLAGYFFQENIRKIKKEK